MLRFSVALSVIAWILFTLLSAGCAGGSSEKNGVKGEPLILFAIDGLEWRIMKPLVESGRMPVMAGLMEKGVYGYLESMLPTYSAVIWTSIATGKTPEKHGIRHFIYEVPGRQGREYRYYTSGHRETKALWNILSDYRLKVHCLGWWMTYPAEAINGTMVSQTNTTSVLREPQRALWKGTLLNGVEGQVYPLEYQNHVMQILEETDASLDDLTARIFGTPPHPPGVFEQMMWDQTEWAFRADATYIRVATDLLSAGAPFDLLALYIGGPDVASHRFWRYAYPEEFDNPPPPDQLENFGGVINDYYAYVDREIGRVLKEAPDDATVMIVSDHGMHAMNRDSDFDPQAPPEKTNSGHHLDAPPGVFIAAGRHINQRSTSVANLDLSRLPTMGRVLDIAPTVLALKGIPIGEDFDGAPIRAAIDIDWMQQRPLRYIPTHDTREWLDARQQRIREAIAQTERLEQLRSLGYIR